ncbi:uncharacterized protein LOC113238412, partial [Hyposmocoma kahamanoa]|uniref:uncharacterized protein LOC113238412 n=1 Tax=Hyposmocoma kahamanoa TaxID=1477025 RepID=UPI000E6D97F8
MKTQLPECVASVCSCAHAERLPTPEVSARVVSIMGELFVNVTWSLPPPKFPQRLPRNLTKQSYHVTIGKEVLQRSLPRYLNTTGLVTAGEDPLYLLVPVTERTGPTPRDGERSNKRITLDVKILAWVALIDERGCVGPEGNATAYDPRESSGTKIGPYILWAALCGACIVVMVGMLAVSARVVKRVLRAFRPAPVSTPHESLCRPAWFPLQRRT